MSLEQATQANQALRLTGPGHPFTTPSHPQHGAFQEYAGRLAEKLVAGEHETQETRQGKAVDALEETVAAPLSVLTEARQEVAALVELGFDGIEVPADVLPHQVRTWKMQRLHAEGKTEQLSSMMAEELRGLGASADAMALLRSYGELRDADPGLRAGIFEQLIRYVHQGNQARFGRPKVDSTAPLEERIKALRETPGFADGTMRNNDRARFDKIQAALDALYQQAFPKNKEQNDVQSRFDVGGGGNKVSRSQTYGRSAGESYGRSRKIHGR